MTRTILSPTSTNVLRSTPEMVDYFDGDAAIARLLE
jgi:hypothetical protein